MEYVRLWLGFGREEEGFRAVRRSPANTGLTAAGATGILAVLVFIGAKVLSVGGDVRWEWWASAPEGNPILLAANALTGTLSLGLGL